MLEKMKVRTGMLLVLACFVVALGLACGLSWLNAGHSVREIEDLNTVAVHQVDPLYEANGALLRTRLALDDALAGMLASNAEQTRTAEQEAAAELAQARERFTRYMEVPKSERGQALALTLQGRFTEYAALLDTLSAAIKERSAAKYQQDV